MSRSTPFRTSWMGSGGIFRARISFRWSGLMLPTALFHVICLFYPAVNIQTH